MHLPADMLQGAVCPLTATLSIAGIGLAAAALLRKPQHAPKPTDCALAGATVFALQMLNYPLPGGLSGHLLGGVFASALLGVPGGVLITSLVLLIQTLLFADGGLGMLGANVLNMAILGAGAGGWFLERLRARAWNQSAAFACAGALSVMLGAGALCLELAACGRLSGALLGTLLGTHLAVAAVEGAATCALLALVPRTQGQGLTRRATAALSLTLAAALALTPLASALPDALEWSLARFHLLPGAPNFAAAPFADYALPAIASEALGTLAAALLGAALLAALAFTLAALTRHLVPARR